MVRKGGKSYGWLWSAALCLLAGYLLTTVLANTRYAAKAPIAGTTLAVAVTIPLAARTRRMLRGAIRGLALGLAGGLGVGLGLFGLRPTADPEALTTAASLAVLLTMICCAAAGALFAYLAERGPETPHQQQD